MGTRTLARKVKTFKGFLVVVGTTKGSGMCQYVVGDRKKAERVGKKMVKFCNSVFKQENLIIDLQKVMLKKCNTSWCKNLCENYECFCEKCNDLMWEARSDLMAERQKEKEEMAI